MNGDIDGQSRWIHCAAGQLMRFIIRFERLLCALLLAVCNMFTVTPEQIERHRARQRPKREGSRDKSFEA